MTWRNVQWLWLLAAIPFAVLFLVVREGVRQRLARRFVADRLRGSAGAARALRPWLLAVALALVAVALAGPLRGFRTVPVTEREASRVILLDVSNSMLAQDLGTSRLAVARAVARRLIDAWPGRVGLVEFESAPEVVAPLTSDTDAVLALLDSVQAGEVGAPGSDLGSGVEMGLRLVEAEPGAKADIVVISDGEDQGSHLAEAIRHAKERGVTISTVLVGGSGGVSIPMGDGTMLRDDAGKIVVTAAHGETLQKLAAATGGTSLDNGYRQGALAPLLLPRTGGAVHQKNVRVPVDRYQWPLAAAFLLLLAASIASRGAE